MAAPTTPLPETISGARNRYDRYAWLRDASMTLDALWVAACPDGPGACLDWLLGTAAADLRNDAPIQIMYGIASEHDLAERTLEYLGVWWDCPVRSATAPTANVNSMSRGGVRRRPSSGSTRDGPTEQRRAAGDVPDGD